MLAGLAKPRAWTRRGIKSSLPPRSSAEPLRSALGRRSTPSPFRIQESISVPGIRPTRSCSFRKRQDPRAYFAAKPIRVTARSTLAILPEAASGRGRVVLFFAGNYPPGEQPSHFHSSHMITFGDRSSNFQAGIRNWVPDDLDIWNRQGLCRLGIADNKLVVLFPKLEMPDLAKTRSLTIAYGGDNNQRRIALDDPRKLSAVLSTIKIVAKPVSIRSPRRDPTCTLSPEMGPARAKRHVFDAQGRSAKDGLGFASGRGTLAHRRLIKRPGRFADPRQRRLLPRNFRFRQEG